MITLKKIETNLHKVELYNNTLYFSYETIVAYVNIYTDELIVSENIWSKTTAKHINKIKREWTGKIETLKNDDFNSRMIYDI